MAFLSLQIGRNLVRTAAFDVWVASCGFDDTAVSEAHTTLAYSKAPVDWENPVFSPRLNTVTCEEGERFFEILDRGVLFLRFESKELNARWYELVQAGASWDYPDFKPHITLSKSFSVVPPELRSDQGLITLGPEYRKQAKAATDVQDEITGFTQNVR